MNSIYVHRAAGLNGCVINISVSVDDKEYDSIEDAENIVNALHKNLPATTLAWVRRFINAKVGNIQTV